MRDFHHTVGILVKAYLNDTLTHGDCTACAVGNIIKACGYQFEASDSSLQPTYWLRLIQNKFRRGMHILIESEAEKQISITGYSARELNAIEVAFENATPDWTNPDYDHMFNSLMNVVDVLAEIHGIDLTEKESAKALFVKA